MPIASDDRGLESLPLKLMVVAIVASLSIIPATEALDSLRGKDFERRAEVQLAQIVSCAKLLAVDGPGNVRSIALDFSGQGRERFSRLLVGDALDGRNSSSVVLELCGGGVIIRSVDQPPARLCSSQGGRLEISSPITGIRMTSVRADNSIFIVVEEC